MRKKPTSKQPTRRKPTPSKGRRRTTINEEEPSREDGGGGGPVPNGTTASEDLNQDEGTAMEPGKVPEKKKTRSELALERFAQAAVQKKIEGLKAEYVNLGPCVPEGASTNAFTQHKTKNRFNNIFCFDHSRVNLKYLVPPEADYIHANWISNTKNIALGDGSWICSQGPLDSTTNDFWRMIWQEKIKHVIMLCRTVELGKPKCAQYWPLAVGESKQYGSITVTNLRPASSEKEHVFESSCLQMTVGNESFQVIQHRWINWPDFGVPESGMGMLRLLRLVRDSKKVLIHCSAGAGRTGTVMAVEICLRALIDGKDVSPIEVLRDLRTQRNGSIQTENQYLFVHKTIFEYLNAKKLSKAECTEFYAGYQEAVKPHGPPSTPPPAATPPATPSNPGI